jgi:hypothetical protein
MEISSIERSTPHVVRLPFAAALEHGLDRAAVVVDVQPLATVLRG